MALLKTIFPTLPPYPPFDASIRRAPKRECRLNEQEEVLAIQNALRYIPKEWHETLIPEFYEELQTRGRIYGYRFRPVGRIYAKPMEAYKGKTLEGKALQLMIDNNLDFEVALYPYELTTYGETGQVCQNWMQYHLIRYYLQQLTRHETLVVMSGHPLGLFPSHPTSSRVIVTNGLMVGMYDDLTNFNRAQALGVANYGQMTAGGWMYIGPQGIVHGTYSTLLNAGRIKLGIPNDQNLAGVLFVSSGLGGMSGAQGKACVIAGGVSIIAEVDHSRIQTRLKQGWVHEVVSSPEIAFSKALQKQEKKQPYAIAYHGNIVDLLDYAVKEHKTISLLSDQTSCHAVYDGGYCPQGMTFEERTALLATNKPRFIEAVNQTLNKHIALIETLVKRGTYFFDYGNSFLKACFDAGCQHICKNGKNDYDGFIYPSYVEDIMGPVLFDYGFGPFRWVCLSNEDADLDKTDQAAMACIDPNKSFQDHDNYQWIKNAKKHQLVVGSKARILYQDAIGRLRIALRFNHMIKNGEIGPIMLGRDHHDTGGTDSPFRETSNIKDGSNVMAEMAIQTALGNTNRGMTLVALHNGGGTGIGKAINGGFGMVLDGSKRVDDILKTAMIHDVLTGVSRRAWAQNPHAITTIQAMIQQDIIDVCLPETTDSTLLRNKITTLRKEGHHE